MGNVCKNSAYSCPAHPSQSLEFICMNPHCLQPLCSQCMEKHRGVHTKMGQAPQIEPYDVVHRELAPPGLKQSAPSQEEMGELWTESYIERLTREYFTRRNERASSAKILINNLQCAVKLSKLPSQKRLKEFFRQELVPNQEVMGEHYHKLF